MIIISIISISIYLFLDIDECTSSDMFYSMNTECANLNGTYDCACLDGYLSTEDGDEYQPGPGCGEFCPISSCVKCVKWFIKCVKFGPLTDINIHY